MSIEAALIGTITRDCERKTSKSGKDYLRLNVAVETGAKTTWLSVTCFDPTAIENAAAYLKGSRVYCEGKLSLSEWAAQDGTTRTGLSVMSWHCRLSQIGRAKTKSEKPKPAPQSADAPLDDEISFAPERRG